MVESVELHPETPGVYGAQVVLYRLTGEEVGHDLGGDGGEQNTSSAVAGGVPETRDDRVATDNRPAVGGSRSQARPLPSDRLPIELRVDLTSSFEEAGHSTLGDARLVADVFDGRADDRFVPPLDHVARAGERDAGGLALRPVQRDHLSANRLYRERPRQAGDPTRPAAGRDQHGPGSLLASRGDDAGHPILVAEQ